MVQHGAAVFQYPYELVGCLGTEHLDARLPEVGNALEYGRGGQVTTGVENGSLLNGIVGVAGLSAETCPLDVDAKLLFENVNLLVDGELLVAENPGTAEGGAAYHDGINPVAVEGSVGLVE